MARFRCPGLDMRAWRPKDIFGVACPHCEATVEFFKDDPVRRCAGCGGEVRNPKIKLGCAEWCAYAEECLGKLRDPDAAS